MMLLHMIAAISYQSGGIGYKGRLPWHKPDDLSVFKQLTTNMVLIVGKRTFDTLPELPQRQLFVWDSKQQPEDVLLHLESVGIRKAWLCGGAYTYERFAPFVNGNRLINYIDYDGPVDSYFPFDAYKLPSLN